MPRDDRVTISIDRGDGPVQVAVISTPGRKVTEPMIAATLHAVASEIAAANIVRLEDEWFNCPEASPSD